MLTLLEEKQKSLEQNLQAVKLEQQMLKVLCKDSTSVYRVDLMNDRAEIVKIEEHSNSAGDLLPHGQELFSYAEAVEHYYHKCVLKESAPDFLQFLDAENLMRELRTKDRVSRRYQSVPNAIGNIYFEVRANRVIVDGMHLLHASGHAGPKSYRSSWEGPALSFFGAGGAS